MLLRKKASTIYWRYFGSLCCPNVKANEITLSTLLRSISSSIKLSCYSHVFAQSNSTLLWSLEAMKLFSNMREKGSMPGVVIYTAVMEGFCKGQQFDCAVRIFRKMQGSDIIPNAFSYGVLIRGICQRKRLENVLEFCMEILEDEHLRNLANLVMFIGLVDGFCEEKSLEEVQNMIKTVRQKGFILEKAVGEYLDKKGPFLPMVLQSQPLF